MTKMGRPEKQIDQKQFEKLCGLQCTKEEIAGFFDCSEDKIEMWCKKTYKTTFSAVFKQKRQAGKISLRRSQMKLAETNATMAIWLGKQHLGQHDEVKLDVRQTVNSETAAEVEKLIDGLDDEISKND